MATTQPINEARSMFGELVKEMKEAGVIGVCDSMEELPGMLKKCRKTKTRFGIFLKIFTINYITFKSGKFAMKKENKIIPAPRQEPS